MPDYHKLFSHEACVMVSSNSDFGIDAKSDNFGVSLGVATVIAATWEENLRTREERRDALGLHKKL